jgi:hypothetical protein
MGRILHTVEWGARSGSPPQAGDDVMEETENPYVNMPLEEWMHKTHEDAWNEGHAVGKVKGYNKALKRFERLIMSEFATGRLTGEETTHINSCLKALRKKVD